MDIEENQDTVSSGVKFATLLKAAQRGKPAVRMFPEPGGGFVARKPDRECPEEALPGQMKRNRKDQVKNSEGGYVFTLSDENRVRRFLIMGTSGGTFYASEQRLTVENMQALVEIIEKGNGAMILREIEEISLAGRNPKQDPVMFALALCARYRVSDTKFHMSKKENPEITKAYALYLQQLHQAAFALVDKVCRIPTHLFSFVKYCEMVSKETCGQEGKSSGWGRQMRDCIVKWYAAKSPDQLAMAVTKYGKREGWSHRDLFRLAHPKTPVAKDDERLLEITQIYRFIVKGTLEVRKCHLTPADASEEMLDTKYSKEQIEKEENSSALNLIETYKSLTKYTPVEQVIHAIKETGLVREHIPTEHLNRVVIWETLLEKMPMTALIRNLAKMQAIDMIKGPKIAEVIDKITDEKAIRLSKIHPVQLLLAHHIYESGHGDLGSLTWNPLPQIVNALEKAFYMSFKNVEATGKRYCYAFDISGSMNSPAAGSSITCRKASVALGMIGLQTEEHVDVVAFCHTLQEIPFTKEWTLKKTCEYFDKLKFGATDCAQPMLWAAKFQKMIDVFVLFTDNETYFGNIHPYDALQRYRKKSGIHDAKLIVVGMSSNGFTIADPNDAGMLDVVGFDAAVPQIMADFVMGRI